MTPYLNATDKDEMTPLMRAAMEGHVDVVQYFLRCRHVAAPGVPNVKIAARDTHGRTALVLAADHMTAVDVDGGEVSKPDQGRAKVIEVLIKHDDEFRDKIEQHDAMIAKIAHDDDAKQNKNDGQNAAEKPREKPKKLVDMADNAGRTALIVAAGNGLEDVVRCLIDTGGADVNLTKKDGSTAIKKAAEWRHQGVVELLASRNATITSAVLHEFR